MILIVLTALEPVGSLSVQLAGRREAHSERAWLHPAPRVIFMSKARCPAVPMITAAYLTSNCTAVGA